MLLKNINIRSLNLLNFNCLYLVLYNAETTPENAKLTILGQPELQNFFKPWSGWAF